MVEVNSYPKFNSRDRRIAGRIYAFDFEYRRAFASACSDNWAGARGARGSKQIRGGFRAAAGSLRAPAITRSAIKIMCQSIGPRSIRSICHGLFGKFPPCTPRVPCGPTSAWRWYTAKHENRFRKRHGDHICPGIETQAWRRRIYTYLYKSHVFLKWILKLGN